MISCTVRLAAVGSLVSVLSTAVFAQDVRPYRPGIDVLDYLISIQLPDTGSVIRGDAMLTVRRTARLDSLVLDLRALEVRQVIIDKRTVRFGRTDSTLAIPLPPGDTGHFRISVLYGGAVTDGLIARKDSAGRWTYFGDNWPNRARFWIPSVDHPSDKATVTWRVTAPASKTVIANGSLLGISRGKRSTTTWRESQPIPTYLMVIAAAPLTRYELGETACGLAELRRCVAQAVYAAPEQRGILPGSFARAGEIVRYFASQVGPFPYEKLSHVQSATRLGGMENATAIFYSDRAFRRGGVDEGTIAHEIAHQWFGDAVTEREWPHIWLSEGFATYFAALWTQRAHGDSAFKEEMARIRATILADVNSVPKRPVIDTIEPVLLALLNRNSYQKGGFVLHMLRSEIGDRQFFGGLRYYYDTHKHATALSADLQDALERASGKKLGVFFDQWLRRPGYPEISVAYVTDSASNRMTVNVTQSGRYGYFEFPLGVAFIDRKGARRYYELGVGAQAQSKIDIGYTGDGIARIEIDPDVKLLARIAAP